MDTRDYRETGSSTKGLIDADMEERYWQESWRSRPYYREGYAWDDYGPAYRTGWEAYDRYGASGKSFDDVELDLRGEYDRNRGTSRLGWEEARHAIRDAWERVKQGLGMAVKREPSAGAYDRGDASLGGSSSSGTQRGMSTDIDGTTCDDVCGTSSGTTCGTSAMSGSTSSGATGSTGIGSSGTGAGGVDGGLYDKPSAGIGGSTIGDTAPRSGDGFNYGYGSTPSDRDVGGHNVHLEGRGGEHERGVHDSVHYLNSFLRGEISACETYRQALQKLGSQFPQLADCLSSHERRVSMLKDRIRSLGGEPSETSGVWGGWAKLVQGAGNLFGERTAIAALEAGEDHGRNDYRRDLDNLDATTRGWVQSVLVPEEERTHRILSDLKHAHV